MAMENGPHAAAPSCGGSLALDPHRIDLWLTFLDDVREESLLAEYRRSMSDAELSQAGRFHFETDRHRYVVTRALVRTTLARYAPIAASDWRFSANAHGRPEIDSNDPSAARISFNVSHTKGLVILAIGYERVVGVDVEEVSTRAVSLDVADRFFASAETAALRALPADLQHERFFRYWTLKESYIKARGLGLSIPLDQFGFELDDQGGMALELGAQLGDCASRWEFMQWRPSNDHLAALCFERTGDQWPRVSLQRVVPLGEEHPLESPAADAPEEGGGPWRSRCQ